MKANQAKDFPKRVLIFIILIIGLFLFGTIGFKIILQDTFENSFIYTIESLAFMFQPESGLAKGLSVFLMLFGVTLVWWILWSLFDMLLEGNFSEYLKIREFLSKLRKMKNHYIIAGGGRVGEDLAIKLASKKTPYIVIEKDILTLNKLKKKGFFVLHGDVTDEAILKQAGILNAKSIILAMPETEKNLLVTMMAKEINPNIEVFARADKPAFVSKLKKAGAKLVVVPEVVAAEKIFDELGI